MKLNTVNKKFTRPLFSEISNDSWEFIHANLSGIWRTRDGHPWSSLGLALLAYSIVASMCLALKQQQDNRTNRFLALEAGIPSSFFGGNKLYRCYGMSESQPESRNSFQEEKPLILISFALNSGALRIRQFSYHIEKNYRVNL